MANMTLQELTDLADSMGFPDPPLAAAVAMAESGGNALAIGDTQPGILGPSIGLWQIDMYFHKQWTQDELMDPETNAQAALAISGNGTNWKPWSTYNSGAYKRYYKPKGGIFPPGGTETLLAIALVAAGGILYYFGLKG